MIIIPELETIVLTPPRCASTSVRDAILFRWPRAMALYRHMERDGMPKGYEQWDCVSLIRRPVDRLYSLYNFMRSLPRPISTPIGGVWRQSLKIDTDRTFAEWLVHSYHAFHSPHFSPYYTMMHYTPVARRSLYSYLRPDLGPIRLFRMETELDEFQDLLRIDMFRSNESDIKTIPCLTAEAVELIRFYHAWDFTRYAIPQQETLQ